MVTIKQAARRLLDATRKLFGCKPVAYRQWSTKWHEWEYATERAHLPRPQDPAEPLYL